MTADWAPAFERLNARLIPRGEPTTDDRQAVVCMLLRARAAELEVLLMRRAERPDDRWSGQVSLPGGHAEPSDADLFAACVRETSEEVGVDLHRIARPLGCLPALQAKARGVEIALTITPFVFAGEGVIDPSPGPEAQEVFWFPLARAASGVLDVEHHYEREGVRYPTPGWGFEGRTVWGLTHRMLSQLMRTMHPALERD